MGWLAILLATQTSVAATWVVDPSGAGDSLTVQGAIDLASSGDTIEIVAATTIEGIDLAGKDLELTGAGSTSTIIGGPGIATCLTATSGETLVASGLSFAGCDSIVDASGASFEFSSVDLWGSADLGSFDAGSWTWSSGTVDWIVGSGLTAASATISWDGLLMQDNELDAPLLACEDCLVELSGCEVADNTVDLSGSSGLFFLRGGTTWIEDLEAHDNSMTDNATGVLDLASGAEGEVLDSWFHGNSTDRHGVSITLGSSSLSTEGCVFEDAGSSIIYSDKTVSYESVDDLFDAGGVSTTALDFDGSGPAIIEGSQFTGFPTGSAVMVLQNPGNQLRNVTVEEGTIQVSDDLLVADSSFTGEEAITTNDSSSTVTVIDSGFAGSRGTAFSGSGAFELDGVTVDGYDEAVCADATVSGSSFTDLVIFTTCGGQLEVSSSDIETGVDGFAMNEGSLTLHEVAMVSGRRAIDISGPVPVTVSDSSIEAGTDGIVFDSAEPLQLSGVLLLAGSDGLRLEASHSFSPTVLIEDSVIEASGGNALAVASGSTPDPDLYRTELLATGAGITTEDNIDHTLYLEDVTIDAAGTGLELATDGSGTVTVTLAGLEIDAGADGITGGNTVGGAGLVMVAGDDCISSTYTNLTSADLSCGGAGIMTSRHVDLEGAYIQPGEECLSGANSSNLEDVTCDGGGGERPITFTSHSWTSNQVTLDDVLITGSSSTHPSSLSGGLFELTNVRFIGNTTSVGAGALELDTAEVTATQLYFEGNSGSEAGALVLGVGSSLDLEGAVFRENTASAGPGAVLDEAGGSYACALFQENSGTAGDVLLTDAAATLRNCTLVGSSSSSTGSLEIDASWATVMSSVVAEAQAGSGVWADASTRMAFLLYNDVHGNAAGEWGGGVTSPTGSNGNLETDPGFVAYSADGDWSNDDLTPASGSPLIDAGHPSWSDGDGSVSDMGVTGSECAVHVDYDGDGRTTTDGDCDDGDASVHDQAAETCDGVDNDCDGLVDAADSDLVGTGTWYQDADGDGYGNAKVSTTACTAPSGWVDNGEDCNDLNSAIHPAATEGCDGVDNDCDELTDDEDDDLTGAPSWYPDADGDGYGDGSDTVLACTAPSGWVASDGDCDDDDATVAPDADEVCDGVDNDCDALTDDEDDELQGAPTWYQDRDGDGYGDDDTTTTACTSPSGHVTVGGDCDDDDSSQHPGAIWFLDQDGDGWGTPEDTQQACEQPAGYAGSASDCDDDEPAIHPGAEEVRGDGVDQDCDGVDPDAVLSDLTTGSLVITEVMMFPAAVDAEIGVWFEIHNASGLRVALRGLEVHEAGLGGHYRVEGSLVADAHDRIVFGASDDRGENGSVPVDEVFEGLDLGIQVEGLELIVSGTTVDQVTWGDCLDFPCPTGASMSLAPHATDADLNDDGASWCPASTSYGAGDLGTPGTPNGPCDLDTGLDTGGEGRDETGAETQDDTDQAPPGDSGEGKPRGCVSAGGPAALSLLALLALAYPRRRRPRPHR